MLTSALKVCKRSSETPRMKHLQTLNLLFVLKELLAQGSL